MNDAHESRNNEAGKTPIPRWKGALKTARRLTVDISVLSEYDKIIVAGNVDFKIDDYVTAEIISYPDIKNNHCVAKVISNKMIAENIYEAYLFSPNISKSVSCNILFSFVNFLFIS